jgi:hypothetical protein
MTHLGIPFLHSIAFMLPRVSVSLKLHAHTIAGTGYDEEGNEVPASQLYWLETESRSFLEGWISFGIIPLEFRTQVLLMVISQGRTSCYVS